MRPTLRLATLTAFAALAMAAAPATTPANDGQTIVAQRGNITLTAADVRDLLAHLAPTARDQMQKNPAMLSDVVRQRMIQLALLQEAQSKKWDQQPDVAYRAALAHDQVILDSYLASLDPADPTFPSEAQIQAAYDANKQRFLVPRQFHLAQIYIAVAADAAKPASDDARKKTADLRQQATRPHADFGDLARKNSQDHASAGNGGDLNWVAENQLAPQIQAAVAGLQEGDVSDPIQMPDGWHLVKLVATKPATVAPLADVRETLVNALRQQRLEQADRTYVTNMQKTEPVQINEIQLSRLLAPQ
jgi:parvulin-like peptidyl-prolyl isomerase